jgi:hypothetical protein
MLPIAAAVSPELSGPQNCAHLVAAGQLDCGVHGLGWLALRVAHHEIDLAALDAASGIDLIDRQLRTATDADAGRRAWSREGRQIADLDRIGVGDGWFIDARCDGRRRGGRTGQRLAARNPHGFLPFSTSTPKTACFFYRL